ncbi:MAG: alpha amylase C-terminal domain-containing protein [Myxococcota bacterium]
MQSTIKNMLRGWRKAFGNGFVTFPELQKLDRAAQTLGEPGRELMQTAMRVYTPRIDASALRLARKYTGEPSVNSVQGTKTKPTKRRVTFVYDCADHANLSNLQLKGSWNTQGVFDSKWSAHPTPMHNLGGGKWGITVDLIDDGTKHAWEWGVIADGPAGKGEWAMFDSVNPSFSLNATTQQVSYAPTTYHCLGARRSGTDGLNFSVWTPHAQEVTVKILHDDGHSESLAMQKDARGQWSAFDPLGWTRLKGKPYVYRLKDSTGQWIERPDPYAWSMQGSQRGLGRLYMHPDTAQETHRYSDTSQELMRFEIQGHMNAEAAYLILKDNNGRALNRAELVARLCAGDASKIHTLRQQRFNDLWSQHIDADGRIALQKLDGAWSALVNNIEQLCGLRYELQVWHKDVEGGTKLVGDKLGLGYFTDATRRASGYNDPWDDRLTKLSGRDPRASLITDTEFTRQHDAAPRQKNHKRWSIYQLHVGSFLGKDLNTKRSTFDDVIKRLDYLKSQNWTTLELLPVNENGGTRDWGYGGVSTLATWQAYGFEDADGRWVSGVEALQRLVDEAHKRGLNVVLDVVYNHVLGDHNFLWNFDGPENVYFDSGEGVRNTDWGAAPAYARREVTQFFTDHAAAMIKAIGVDGLRYDFTEPMKSTSGGGLAGWNMLRKQTATLDFLRKRVFTLAEQFDYDPAMTRSRRDGGAGFTHQWYTATQHRMVRDNGASGLVQAAAHGGKTGIDALMGLLVNPRGIGAWEKAAYMISNHDEVGNAERTIKTAMGDADEPMPSAWARNIARLVRTVGFFAPGIPFMFQGDEFYADNPFGWGKPGQWDMPWQWAQWGNDWDWQNFRFNEAKQQHFTELLGQDNLEKSAAYQDLTPIDRQVIDHLRALDAEARPAAMQQIYQRLSVRSVSDALAIRQTSCALAANVSVEKIHTSNKNGVFAFRRHQDDDDFVVIGNVSHQPLTGYPTPLPPGDWQEIHNTDSSLYGGSDFGNQGKTLAGGHAQINLPAGGVVVFKRRVAKT